MLKAEIQQVRDIAREIAKEEVSKAMAETKLLMASTAAALKAATKPMTVKETPPPDVKTEPAALEPGHKGSAATQFKKQK